MASKWTGAKVVLVYVKNSVLFPLICRVVLFFANKYSNFKKAAMNNNNGYGVELTSSMAQNNMPTNYGRYQVANGQFVGTMNSAPMFATVDVAGGYNAIGATYQQYYPFTQTVYNPAEIFQVT